MTEDIAEDTYESELLNLRSEHIDEVLAAMDPTDTVSYTHLRAHETVLDIVCRLLLEKKKQTHIYNH